MRAFTNLMKHLAAGVGVGLLGTLAAWIVGLFGAKGSYLLQTSTVLALETMVALVLLGASVVTTQFGPLFHLRLQEEDYQRRSSMIPVLLALSVTVLLAYLLFAPYTPPGS